MVAWTRLIRFRAANGSIYNGEPIVPSDSKTTDVAELYNAGSLKAKVISGDDVFADSAKVTDQVEEVKELLGPLTPEQVPIIRCVGLNYMKHSK